MFQRKYGNETTIKAFKDFHKNFNVIENGSNETIQVGYPDELTTPELLNDVYKHIKLGEYELYELHHILQEFNFNLFSKTIKSVSSKNILENAIDIGFLQDVSSHDISITRDLKRTQCLR